MQATVMPIMKTSVLTGLPRSTLIIYSVRNLILLPLKAWLILRASLLFFISAIASLLRRREVTIAVTEELRTTGISAARIIYSGLMLTSYGKESRSLKKNAENAPANGTLPMIPIRYPAAVGISA